VAAPAGHLKVSRYFLVLVVIIAGLYALVFFTGTKKPHPKLGLDLQGGAAITLSALTPDGRPPSASSLDQARSIIANRVNASGVTEPEVVTEGNRNLVVSVAGGTNADELKKLVAPAKLTFRKVLQTTQNQPGLGGPEPACGVKTPVVATSPSASKSASASPSTSASAKPSTSPSVKPSASAPASASASASGSPSPSKSLNPSEQTAAQLKAQALASAKAKLGPAYDEASQIQDPTQVNAADLAVFRTLTCAEVAAIPAQMQFMVPTVTCSMLNGRDPGALEDDTDAVVACDQSGTTKYALDVAKVQGTDVATASSDYDPQNYPSDPWIVKLHFTGKGQDKWTALTQEAMQNAQQNQGGQSQGGAQVAIVLDNEVVSAPQIQQVIPGDAVINGGDIDENSSKLLATQLKYGALPLNFALQDFETVSPTLGLQQMGYGLLAGAIGLILVVLYCFFYYRALGLVVIASLGVSGATVFAMLVLLGRYMGFTLSLAGIAGFIVAIGITADSFVVFFERLKDEVKEGRTVRSAVPRAWVRARRTILSADAVSFLAAAVLYLLAAGPVKGFAFTLGLSTVIDLLVVFLFTHPLVAVLSRSNAFTSPRFSGLGNLRSDKALEAAALAAVKSPRFGAVRTKES
jgi:preprotein translocase subunit SecD